MATINLNHEVALERTATPVAVVVVEGSDTVTLEQLVLGNEGTTRRNVTYALSAFVLATLVRMLAFSPLVFGTYLLENLGPVERETVRWGWILVVRAIDVMMGGWIWTSITPLKLAKNGDGALFGALYAGLSRTSLYAFEHSYFLLSTTTTTTIFLIDVISLAAAFSILPTFFPRQSVVPFTTTPQRRLANRELLLNTILAITFSTVAGAILTRGLEILGGYSFVEIFVYEVKVPSILSADSMTTSQMMKHPLISVPSLRSTLSHANGILLSSHLQHSLVQAVLSVPFIALLPHTLDVIELSFMTFDLIFPASFFLLWDVLPINIFGAFGVALGLAARGAVITGSISAITRELSRRKIVVEETILLEEEDEASLNEIPVVKGKKTKKIA